MLAFSFVPKKHKWEIKWAYLIRARSMSKWKCFLFFGKWLKIAAIIDRIINIAKDRISFVFHVSNHYFDMARIYNSKLYIHSAYANTHNFQLFYIERFFNFLDKTKKITQKNWNFFHLRIILLLFPLNKPILNWLLLLLVLTIKTYLYTLRIFYQFYFYVFKKN